MVSLAGVASLDAAVLSSLVRTHGKLARTGRKVRVVNATPDVAQMLRDLGLAWMLEGARFPTSPRPTSRCAAPPPSQSASVPSTPPGGT